MSWESGTHAKVKKVNYAPVAEKVGPKGGEGTAWDDGSDHDGVTQIYVRPTGAGISYVLFRYVKDGQTKDACHGRYYKGSTTTEIMINHPDEYLLSVEGWYDSDNIIKGIQFITNKNTSDYIGYKFHGVGTAFTLRVQDKKIIGFFGCTGDQLNSIGAYFVPSSWDDGEHAKVKKVQLTYDDVIYSIQVTYDQTTVQPQRHGSVGRKSAEFTLASDEYITALSAYCKTLSSQDVISALTFTTNKRTSETYGNKSDYEISAPEATGKQIAGFLGSSGKYLNSIDVHYAPVPSGSGAEKVGPKGGAGGTAWDDGSDHDGLTKIYVGYDKEGIYFVNFDYVKGAHHGVHGRKSTEVFGINHPEEYLLSVEGWYKSSIIQGIQFRTNHNTSAYIGYESDGTGTEFTLQVPEKRIIGFFGFSSDHLHSIGAYFVPISKLEAEGGETGVVWDDGPHDDVKKVYVGLGYDGISALKFEYTYTSNEHGTPTKLGYEEFELESDEYITSMEGTCNKIYGSDSSVVTMLKFETNKNKTHGPFGIESGKAFVYKDDTHKIVGFHGRASTGHESDSIHAIGVYLAPRATTPLTPATPT